MAGQTRGRPRYIGGRALTRLAAWLAVHRRQLLQRAEDDARGRRRCAEDETMRTTTALSRRQVRATRRAGNFLTVSRVFLSSGVPERAPEGRGCPGLAGWMKAQIRAKTRIRGHGWTIFRRSNEKKKRCRRPRRAPGWRCSYKHVLLLDAMAVRWNSNRQTTESYIAASLRKPSRRLHLLL
jgi:hypothetical protein